MHFVYMIKNRCGKLYIGITENTEERIRYHNAKQGAQFTKTDSKFDLIFKEEWGSLQEARKREIQL